MPHTPQGGAKSTSTRSPSVRATSARSCPLRHSVRRCPPRCRQPHPPQPQPQPQPQPPPPRRTAPRRTAPRRTAPHPTTNQRGCARRRRGSPRDPPFAAHTPAAPAFIWVPEPWLVKLAPGCQSLAGRQSLAPAPDPSAPCVSRPPHTSHPPLSTAPRFGPVATLRVAHAASPCCAGLVRHSSLHPRFRRARCQPRLRYGSRSRTCTLSTAPHVAHTPAPCFIIGVTACVAP